MTLQSSRKRLEIVLGLLRSQTGFNPMSPHKSSSQRPFRVYRVGGRRQRTKHIQNGIYCTDAGLFPPYCEWNYGLISCLFMAAISSRMQSCSNLQMIQAAFSLRVILCWSVGAVPRGMFAIHILPWESPDTWTYHMQFRTHLGSLGNQLDRDRQTRWFDHRFGGRKGPEQVLARQVRYRLSFFFFLLHPSDRHTI
jgi:hypothetical protein